MNGFFAVCDSQLPFSLRQLIRPKYFIIFHSKYEVPPTFGKVHVSQRSSWIARIGSTERCPKETVGETLHDRNGRSFAPCRFDLLVDLRQRHAKQLRLRANGIDAVDMRQNVGGLAVDVSFVSEVI